MGKWELKQRAGMAFTGIKVRGTGLSACLLGIFINQGRGKKEEINRNLF